MSSVRDFAVAFQLPNARNALSAQGSASVDTMERTMWTDERLTDRFDNIDRSLERVDADIRELRTAVNQLWASTIVGFLVVIATVIATNS
jgi:hypothetical protein